MNNLRRFWLHRGNWYSCQKHGMMCIGEKGSIMTGVCTNMVIFFCPVGHPVGCTVFHPSDHPCGHPGSNTVRHPDKHTSEHECVCLDNCHVCRHPDDHPVFCPDGHPSCCPDGLGLRCSCHLLRCHKGSRQVEDCA